MTKDILLDIPSHAPFAGVLRFACWGHPNPDKKIANASRGKHLHNDNLKPFKLELICKS